MLARVLLVLVKGRRGRSGRRGIGEEAGNQKSEFQSLQPTRFCGEKRGYLLKGRARTGQPQDVGVPGAEMHGWG